MHIQRKICRYFIIIQHTTYNFTIQHTIYYSSNSKLIWTHSFLSQSLIKKFNEMFSQLFSNFIRK